ncbi:hypothetical protein COB18_00210 [Candidatus Kaiserbacteria bacterium]|nr:MAG: hypothetical protein COB18_00210 [Candidatus Kaiserbacteria bacterium]
MIANQFTLEVGEFKGPLELLLNLIEQRKLQVNDISLAQVSDDYIHYIEDRSQVPLSETAQFVVVASTLLLIKSRSLLPTIELSSDEEDDIRDLEHRLQMYAHARRASKLVKKSWHKQSFLPKNLQKREIIFAPAADITIESIQSAASKLLSELPTFVKKPTARIKAELKLEDVIESLARRMRTQFSGSFKTLTSKADRVSAIVHFLALLELVKQGTLGAVQNENFSDIAMEYEEVGTPKYGG